MRYLSVDRSLTQRISIHGGLWTNMNLPRIIVGYEEGCEYVDLSYGTEGCDSVLGVCLDLSGTQAGKVLSAVAWRLYRLRHPAATVTE